MRSRGWLTIATLGSSSGMPYAPQGVKGLDDDDDDDDDNGVAIPHRRCETTYRSHFQGSSIQRLAFNPLKPELIPICHLLALLGAHHFLHVSRIRVKLLTFRLLMSCIYGALILDVSRSHTTTQHSR